jgi:hypothetical protein
MAIDVITYEGLKEVEKQLLLPDSELPIGSSATGVSQSKRVGTGIEIEGLQDYMPGDEARFIDPLRSAMRWDDGFTVRRYHDEQDPLTVLISDMPSDTFGNTLGNPLGVRATGMVVCYAFLKQAQRTGSPILVGWSARKAFQREEVQTFSGVKSADHAIEAGLDLAQTATDHALSGVETQGRKVFRKKVTTVTEVPNEGLAGIIDQARVKANRIASLARFIVVSDFRYQTEEVLEATGALSKYGEVITLEVTNPLLRSIPKELTVINRSGQKNQIVESNAQREKIEEVLRQRQEQITSGLARVSTLAYSVDTSDLGAIQSLYVNAVR